MAGSDRIGAPAECYFERRRGDTKDIAIRLTQDGSPIATAVGYSALFTINTVKEPDNSVSPEIGIEIFQAVGSPNSPATDAILRFDFADFDGNLSPEVTEVAVGNYFYDIQVTNPDGEISTPQIGKFIVKQDITKN